MDTFLELIQALQSDLNIDSNNTLFPLSTVKSAINRAYRKSGSLFKWPETEDALKTSSVADQEYYDYPDTWKPDSAWKLLVDDVDYGDPLAFKDYLYEKEEDIPSDADYLWSSQWRRLFIYPTPTASGSNNICVWGQKIVSVLTADSDVTIFSYSMSDCNDAIIQEAESILKDKSDNIVGSQFKSAKALQTLTIAWGKVREEQAKYERSTPMLNVSDMFGRENITTKIGKF